MPATPRRLIVGITGASGVVYGVRLLQALREEHSTPPVETHLILSEAARVTLALETEWRARDVEALADAVYAPRNVAAAIASGSFAALGMVVVPCSIKTLSAIAHSYADTLIARAADVQLKEGRPLVLVVRETPLHLGHLRLMTQAAESGAIIFPPVPTFYARPHSLDDIITATVGRILARLGLENALYTPWQGSSPADER